MSRPSTPSTRGGKKPVTTRKPLQKIDLSNITIQQEEAVKRRLETASKAVREKYKAEFKKEEKDAAEARALRYKAKGQKFVVCAAIDKAFKDTADVSTLLESYVANYSVKDGKIVTTISFTASFEVYGVQSGVYGKQMFFTDGRAMDLYADALSGDTLRTAVRKTDFAAGENFDAVLSIVRSNVTQRDNKNVPKAGAYKLDERAIISVGDEGLNQEFKLDQNFVAEQYGDDDVGETDA
jgi:hypothetical protein